MNEIEEDDKELINEVINIENKYDGFEKHSTFKMK